MTITIERVSGVYAEGEAGPAGLSKPSTIDELKETVNACAIRHLREICTVSKERLACFDSYASKGKWLEAMTQLTAGVFYANDVFKRLKLLSTNGCQKASEELACLKARDAFYHVHLAGDTMESFPRYQMENGLMVKAGVKAADAARACKQGQAFLRCDETIELVWSLALLEILGDEKFNTIFAHDSNTPFSINAQFDQSCLRKLKTLRMINGSAEEPVFRGEWIDIRNDPYYIKLHVVGLATNMNCLVTTDGTIKVNSDSSSAASKPKPEPEVIYLGGSSDDESLSALRKGLFDALKTEDRLGYEIYSDDLQSKMPKPQILKEDCQSKDEKEWEHDGGGKLNSWVMRLNYRKIQCLVDCDAEIAASIHQQWPDNMIITWCY